MQPGSVDLEVMSRKLQAITDEMYFSVQRASRSSYVKEAADFATALLDTEGEVFAYPPSATFSFLIDADYRSTIDAVPNLRLGDVIITNDPYTSHGLSTHLPDLHLIQPYFHEGQVVAYGWSFVHCSDVGGAVPGSVSPALTSIFQEGFRIPPMRLVKQGVLNDEFLALLRVNSRMPEVVIGDLRAMLGALEVGGRRIAELIARQGAERLLAAQRDLQDDTEQKARAVFRRIPDGEYQFWDLLDDDMVSAIPIRVRLTMRVRDGTVQLDLTGTDPAVRSAYNVPSMGRRMYWISFRLTTILTTLDPLMAHNAGMYRPVSVVLPPGSVVNAEYPDAVSVRNSVPYRVFDSVSGAVLTAVPGFLPAPAGGTIVTISLAEMGGDGARTVEVIQPMRCGMGAFDGRDGFDARDNSLNNMRNQPTELVEAQSRVRILDYDVRPDSGGPGKWRGGMGQAITVEVLCDGATFLARGLDRMRFPAFGVAGGWPGGELRIVLNAGTPGEQVLAKIHELHVRCGDTITLLMPGGGGYGDPLERDPGAVLADVEQGFVTPEGALRDYGVVVSGGALDGEATTAVRNTRRGAPQPAFRYGPDRVLWEQVFTDDVMARLNAHLYALPKALRQDTRTRLFEVAVPGISAPARGPLAPLLPDPEAARARLLAALEEASA